MVPTGFIGEYVKAIVDRPMYVRSWINDKEGPE